MRSVFAFWLGGVSSVSDQVAFRSLQAFWLGGASSTPPSTQAALRSMLAFWLGGASSGEELEPEPESGGGAFGGERRTGGGRAGHLVERLRRPALQPIESDEFEEIQTIGKVPRPIRIVGGEEFEGPVARSLFQTLQAPAFDAALLEEFTNRFHSLREADATRRQIEAEVLFREAFVRGRALRNTRIRADEDELAIAMLALMMNDE